MELFFASQNWLFLLAVILLLALAAIEGLALLLGFSVSSWLDQFVPEMGDGAGALADSWLGWLHVGKVPVLVILVILLTAFASIGLVFAASVQAVLGRYPPALLSGGLAFVAALPVVRFSAQGIARLIPRDESSAGPLENLVGRVGVVINGTARVNYPAQARVRNAHGLTLYIHVEPDQEGVVLANGDSVLLVKQISGTRFLAIANPRPEVL